MKQEIRRNWIKYSSFPDFSAPKLVEVYNNNKNTLHLYKRAIEGPLGHFCTERELNIFVDLKYHQFKYACAQPQPFQAYSLYTACNMSDKGLNIVRLATP